MRNGQTASLVIPVVLGVRIIVPPDEDTKGEETQILIPFKSVVLLATKPLPNSRLFCARLDVLLPNEKLIFWLLPSAQAGGEALRDAFMSYLHRIL